jgi:hypothetical protein
MKRRSLALTFSLLFGFGGALAASACSSSSTDAATAACERLFRASETECTKSPSDAVEANRAARAPASCKRALTASGVTTKPSDLDACSAVLEKRTSCEATLDSPAECEPKPGTRGDGAGCGTDAQCKSGYCKIGVTQVTTGDVTLNQPDACGSCTATVAENAACSGTSDRCVAGYQCLSGKCLKVAVADVGGACGNQTTVCNDALLCDNLTRKCVARKSSGADCGGNYECEPPLACVANKCDARVLEGGACSSTASTSSTECARKLFCDEATQTCVKYQLVKAGAACTPTSICEPLGIACPESATCPVVAGDGEACDVGPSAARACNEGATCRDGKCVLDDPNTCK